MENKLQELTRKLYDEGLSKGREESERILAEARDKAGKIVAEARAEADRIKKQAQTEAEDLRKNTLTELNLSGKQVLAKLKSEIQDLIITKSAGDSVAKANIDPEFIKTVLTEVAKNWAGSTAGKVTLEATLPSALKEKFDSAAAGTTQQLLNEGVTVGFSDNVKSGFRIGPKDGGYFISFTDADFEALVDEYLRPKVSKILFGEQN